MLHSSIWPLRDCDVLISYSIIVHHLVSDRNVNMYMFEYNMHFHPSTQSHRIPSHHHPEVPPASHRIIASCTAQHTDHRSSWLSLPPIAPPHHRPPRLAWPTLSTAWQEASPRHGPLLTLPCSTSISDLALLTLPFLARLIR